MDTDVKTLVKYGYDQLVKKDLACRYFFDDWIHLENLNKQLKVDSKILDVGCGSGIPIAKYLSEKGHKIIGIDISEGQINLAKKNVAGGEFLLMDMQNLTFPNNSFDCVVCFYTIHHLPRALHKNLLESFYKILRGNGYLMITMGTQEYEEVTEEYKDIKLFWSNWKREKNLQILRETEFELIYQEIHKSGGDEHLIIFAKKLKKAGKRKKRKAKIIYQRRQSS